MKGCGSRPLITRKVAPPSKMSLMLLTAPSQVEAGLVVIELVVDVDFDSSHEGSRRCLQGPLPS